MDDESDEGLEERVGESSWPASHAGRNNAAAASSSSGGDGGGAGGGLAVRKGIYQRLRAIGNEEALSDPFFEQLLDEHYERLPASYSIDLQVDKAEDVLLHRRILAECADPDKRPVFHARFLRCFQEEKPKDAASPPTENGNGGGPLASALREDEFPCERMMEDLSLGKRNGVDDFEAISARRDTPGIRLIHEIIFSSIDKPKLLSQLSALLSEIGLNIREAHVFSTTDGLCLDVFVVDGWETEETDGLLQQLKETAKRSHPSLSNPTNSSTSERIKELQEQIGDSEFDRNLLQPMDKFASGSSGDLYRGTYLGMDVAIKYLRAEHVNGSSNVEFLQEIMILRSVNHENVVRFYGACTKHRKYLIVTEYMPGGNLYDFLHKQNNTLQLPVILRIAIGISKGMDYLHQNNIIHRDLKTANLLIGNDQVVKIADFGVSRHRSQEGDMTAETGTYRWMAPESRRTQKTVGPVQLRADVFSFAIVLWELVTSKIPYENLTPLQAALSVRQGFRLVIPKNVHPRLSKLIRQCWDENPQMRPVFSDITVELEDILRSMQASNSKGPNRHTKQKTQVKSPR